jgi:dihydrofolate reductase
LTAEPLYAIAAMARGRVIGHGNTLPWRVPEDLRFFKKMTVGHSIIMGRKTYESTGKPLPQRRNIVITRQPGYAAPGCEVVGTLEDAVAAARTSDPEPFIIGGAEIYRQALPTLTRMYLTFIDREVPGDAFFPEYDPAQWRETERRVGESTDVVFVTLERVR